jgi:hypothetical protein
MSGGRPPNEVRGSHRRQGLSYLILNLGIARKNLRAMVRSISLWLRSECNLANRTALQ